jgi:hypothetical protein
MISPAAFRWITVLWMAYCRLWCPTGSRLNDISGTAGKTWSRPDSRVLSMFSTASLMMIFGCG